MRWKNPQRRLPRPRGRAKAALFKAAHDQTPKLGRTQASTSPTTPSLTTLLPTTTTILPTTTTILPTTTTFLPSNITLTVPQSRGTNPWVRVVTTTTQAEPTTAGVHTTLAPQTTTPQPTTAAVTETESGSSELWVRGVTTTTEAPFAQSANISQSALKTSLDHVLSFLQPAPFVRLPREYCLQSIVEDMEEGSGEDAPMSDLDVLWAQLLRRHSNTSTSQSVPPPPIPLQDSLPIGLTTVCLSLPTSTPEGA